MTLPEQSDRAVAQTRKFLVRLVSPYDGGIKGIKREVRAEALALLRHYPYVWLSQDCDCPDQDNATNHDAAPAARAQPNPAGRDSGNAAGTGDILTAEEREAVRVAAAVFQRERRRQIGSGCEAGDD